MLTGHRTHISFANSGQNPTRHRALLMFMLYSGYVKEYPQAKLSRGSDTARTW